VNGLSTDHYISFGDFNNDGLLDMLVTTDYLPHDGPTLFVLENIGNLNFNRTTILPDGKSRIETESVSLNQSFLRAGAQLADINGDGNLDVIAILRDSDNGVLVYYLNNGSGAFSDPVILLDSLQGSGSLAIGDMDNDGDLDIAVVSRNRNILWIYKNDLAESGEFVPKVVNPSLGPVSNTITYGVTLADLTGSGTLDMIGAVSIMWKCTRTMAIWNSQSEIPTKENPAITAVLPSARSLLGLLFMTRTVRYL